MVNKSELGEQDMTEPIKTQHCRQNHRKEGKGGYGSQVKLNFQDLNKIVTKYESHKKMNLPFLSLHFKNKSQ